MCAHSNESGGIKTAPACSWQAGGWDWPKNIEYSSFPRGLGPLFALKIVEFRFFLQLNKAARRVSDEIYTY